MRTAYLGLFSKIFDWVFSKILAPVVEFLASLLSKVFEWIFNTILEPILTLVIKTVVPWILDLIKKLLASVFYAILAYLCKIVDYMAQAFDVFSGTQLVQYKTNNKTVNDTLLNVLISQPAIKKIFVWIMGLSFALALTFCIIAVIKSTLDFDFDGKKSVGQVMRTMMKTVVQFMMVPFLTIFILSLSTIVLNAIEESSYSGTKPKSLGCIIFAVSSLEASKIPTENLSQISATADPLSVGARAEFYTGAKSYMDKNLVKECFEYSNFDYFTGYVVSLFLVVILAMTAIIFIQRIFEVLVLYVVSPFFVSTMPLDDGEKFKKWKELFVGKIFSGYGSVLAMKIYLILVPIIMSNAITWGGSGTSKEAAYLIKMIFLIGGAWATTKIGSMITTLISFQAGTAERETSAMVGALAGRAISGTIVGGARMLGSGIGSMFGSKGGESGLGGGGEDVKAASGSKNIADQKWRGMNKNMRAGFPTSPGKGDDKPGDKPGGMDIGGSKEEEKKENPNDKLPAANKMDRFLAACHRILPHKYDEKGNYSFGLLGFRVNYNKDGRRTGFSVPFASFKYDKGKDGKISSRIDSFNAAGLFKLQRTGSGEKSSMSLSDIPAIGLHREADPDGGMHVQGIMGLKFGMEYNQDSKQYEISGCRVGNYIFGGEKYKFDADKNIKKPQQ